MKRILSVTFLALVSTVQTVAWAQASGQSYVLLIPPQFLGITASSQSKAGSESYANWVPTTIYASEQECEADKAGMQWGFVDEQGRHGTKPIPTESVCVPSTSRNQAN
jgi:hypothetical protein